MFLSWPASCVESRDINKYYMISIYYVICWSHSWKSVLVFVIGSFLEEGKECFYGKVCTVQLYLQLASLKKKIWISGEGQNSFEISSVGEFWIVFWDLLGVCSFILMVIYWMDLIFLSVMGLWVLECWNRSYCFSSKRKGMRLNINLILLLIIKKCVWKSE